MPKDATYRPDLAIRRQVAATLTQTGAQAWTLVSDNHPDLELVAGGGARSAVTCIVEAERTAIAKLRPTIDDPVELTFSLGPLHGEKPRNQRPLNERLSELLPGGPATDGASVVNRVREVKAAAREYRAAAKRLRAARAAAEFPAGVSVAMQAMLLTGHTPASTNEALSYLADFYEGLPAKPGRNWELGEEDDHDAPPFTIVYDPVVPALTGTQFRRRILTGPDIDDIFSEADRAEYGRMMDLYKLPIEPDVPEALRPHDQPGTSRISERIDAALAAGGKTRRVLCDYVEKAAAAGWLEPYYGNEILLMARNQHPAQHQQEPF